MSNHPLTKNWRKVKLGEVAQDIRDLYEPKPIEHLPYIGLEHIERNSLRLNSLGISSSTQSGKKRFNPGDVLFGSLRPYFRKVVRPKYSGVCSTDITVLRVKEGYDQHWLFYFIANQSFIDYATKASEGTRMPRANWKSLAQTKWTMPPLATQCRIASILSAFDDKIELNNKINQALEQMAQAIFKEWFVNFRFPGNEKVKMVDSEMGKIPEGWVIDCLGRIVDITSGKRPNQKPTSVNKVNDVPLIGANGVMGYVKDILYDEPMLIIGRVGTHGVVQRINIPCWPSDNTLVIKSRYYEYVFNILKRIDYESLNRGSTQPLITQGDMKNYPIIIPAKTILQMYEDKVSALFSEISSNARQNNSLETLRDMLLPKLMSGEVRV